MNTLNKSLSENLSDYHSEYIVGTRDKLSKTCSVLTDIDFKLIFQEINRVIKINLDIAGPYYESKEYIIAYKIYDIKVIHYIDTISEMRYDVSSGFYEDVYLGYNDKIEIVSVTDIDGKIHKKHLLNLINYIKNKNI